jgi:hypothetical protein
LAQEAPYPTLRGIVRVGITPRHKRHKVGQFVLAIRKRIACRLRFDLQIGEVGWRMLEPCVAGKREFFGARIKAGDGNKIAKNVVQPPYFRRFGRYC